MYGIVGDGNTARHMVRYLSLMNLPHAQWARSFDAPLEEQLRDCDTILLLVSDGAIESVATEHSAVFGRKCLVHFSGSLVTPKARGVHPLYTFGPATYRLDTYRQIPFVYEAGSPGFTELFPDLPNPHFEIDPSDKPLYHALAVLGGNFTTLLWRHYLDKMSERFGIAPDKASPYLRQIAENVLNDPDTALTGPLARGDLATLRADIAAMTDDRFGDVFKAVVRATRPDLMEDLR